MTLAADDVTFARIEYFPPSEKPKENTPATHGCPSYKKKACTVFR